MRLGNLLPPTFQSALSKYVTVSLLRGLWNLADTLHWPNLLMGFVPSLTIIQQIERYIYLFRFSDFPIEAVFIGIVSMYLKLYQWILIFGAVRLFYLRFVHIESGRDGQIIDGRGLRRPGWMRPITTTVAIIFCCYAVVWVVLLLTDHSRPQFAGFYNAVAFAGPWPMAVGAFLGLLGAIAGLRFSAQARSLVGTMAGVTYLSADDGLTQRVHALADRLAMPRPAVGVSNVMNAFAVGTSLDDAAVVIGRPLLDVLDADELDAVIGHELGHIVSSDMWHMQFAAGYKHVFGSTVEVLTVAGAQMTRERGGAPIIQLAGLILHSTIMLGAELMAKRLSRSREFYADAIGAGLTSPAAMIRALDKIHTIPAPRQPVEDRYGYLMFRAKPGWAFLFATHPNLNRRRKALAKESYLNMLPRKAVPGMPAPVRSRAPAVSDAALVGLTAVLAALEAPSRKPDEVLGAGGLSVQPRDMIAPPDRTWPVPTPRVAMARHGRAERGSPRYRLAILAGAAVLVAAVALFAWWGPETVYAAVDDAIGTVTGLKAREAELAAREDALASREAALRRDRAAVGSLEISVAARESAVASRASALDSRETAIAYREKRAAEKEASLDAREQALAQQSAALSRPLPAPPAPPPIPGLAPGGNPAEQFIATVGPVIAGAIAGSTAGETTTNAYPPDSGAMEAGMVGIVLRGGRNQRLFRGQGVNNEAAFGQAFTSCRATGNPSCALVATLQANANRCFVVAVSQRGRHGYGTGPTLNIAGERAVADCRRAGLFASCVVDRSQNFCLTP